MPPEKFLVESMCRETSSSSNPEKHCLKFQKCYIFLKNIADTVEG